MNRLNSHPNDAYIILNVSQFEQTGSARAKMKMYTIFSFSLESELWIQVAMECSKMHSKRSIGIVPFSIVPVRNSCASRNAMELAIGYFLVCKNRQKLAISAIKIVYL